MDAVTAIDRVQSVLDETGLECRRHGPRAWMVAVPLTRRGPLGVAVSAGERTLDLRTFVMRGPDRAHEDVYRRLLRKNLGLSVWRFALDDAGDVFAVADVPLEGLDADGLDGVLGLLATTVDGIYEAILRTGFDVPDGTVLTAPPPASGGGH
ncbi:MAG: YbjN domain-containing protein [Actinomycetota bacterium]